MDIFRLKNWTHYEPKRPKGTNGLSSAGFRPPKGLVAVMAHVGNLPEANAVTDQWLARQLFEDGAIEALLGLLTDEQRLEAISDFCTVCGALDCHGVHAQGGD